MALLRYILVSCLLGLMVLPFSAQDQPTLTVTNALVLSGPDWYQSFDSVDPIEASRVLGTWTAPAEGDSVRFPSGRVERWAKVEADSAGWMHDRRIRNGYVYVGMKMERDTVLVLEGMAHRMVYVNGEPRSGNLYQTREQWQPWEPPFDYSRVPVFLRRGQNELLFLGGRAPRMKIRFHEAHSAVLFNARDVTRPDLIVGKKVDALASVVVINATNKPLAGAIMRNRLEQADPTETPIPTLPPLGIHKVPFRIVGDAPNDVGSAVVRLEIRIPDGTIADTTRLVLDVREPNANHRRTFVSRVDGSVQYYGLNPAPGGTSEPRALFLSVHGAAVEAINQSASYRAKSWGHIVAPTNRRPYGFNWEDWGRMDALEVLDIAEATLNVNPDRVYLTGHSMGGHGTWHLGALYPDRFAAIGPSAGWISFWSYRPASRPVPSSPIQSMLFRATLPSHTFDLAPNYEQLGVYVIHGADDDNVTADQSRQMVARLETFHRDFVYHEEPDAGHWWDKSDEDGADCVDWSPLFDFFARHARPRSDQVQQIRFSTPSPGISPCNNWICVEAQAKQLEMSTVDLRLDPGKRRYVGSTENISRLSIDVSQLDVPGPVELHIDESVVHTDVGDKERIHLEKASGQWRVATESPPSVKGPHRYGTFKDVFRNNVVLVYGSQGTEVENTWALARARFDAETFWYQGNGSFPVVKDEEFDLRDYPDRNVVLYGNATTNAAWPSLLGDSPVQVEPGQVTVGESILTGTGLAVLFVRPRADSDVASVGAVSGTGIEGMRLTDRRPYLSPGFAYPDLVVFDADRISAGRDVTRVAGFFGLDWGMDGAELVWVE